ncbi:O-antigen ligase family protein [Chloroflexus sp.]|uniref:O-antigen ligase family protein n=1 Tax=Chloroflexus sp. TaxID=1904827 RepID=UPI00262805B3|nr:O-antigen ligase family protein [uncultured Chloroflexus sp.]
MIVTGPIILNPLELALLGLIGLYAVWRGRPEIVLAIYLSVSLWTRTVFVGPLAATWPLLATIVLALIRYLHVARPWSLLPNRLDLTTRQIFPTGDTWIVPWMGLWWAWALCVLLQFDLRDKMSILRPVILYIIVGSLVALMTIRDASAARRFAIAYLLTSAYGLYAALRFIEVPLSYLLSDPGLSSLPYRNLGIREYNYFSHHLSIAFVLGLGLFLQARHLWSMMLFAAVAFWCGYGVFLTGARQSLSGAGVAAALIFVWALSRQGSKPWRVPLIIAAIVMAVVLIYQVAPHLVVREGESGLEESFNIFEDRGGLWEIGWNYFLASPVWGWGFEQKLWSHNLFIGTLADQGLVGMVFFLGYLIWALRRLPVVWAQTPDDDRAVWRIVFFAIFVFALVHGQASGNTMITAHLHWSLWAVWALGSGVVVETMPKPLPMPPRARLRPAQAGGTV